MGTSFGTCCAPGARMWARGSVYPLFVTQHTWFVMSDVCNVKGAWMEHGVECLEIHDYINVEVGFTLGKRNMGHIKLLFSKGGSLI